MELEEEGWYKVIVYQHDEGLILDTIWGSGSWDRLRFSGEGALKTLLESLTVEYVERENENVGNYLPDWVSFQPLFIETTTKQKILDILQEYIQGIDEARLKPQERNRLKEWRE
jgi:hypothetical protein